MITLSDVAKQANVSKMTVSRVINHPEQVTLELRTLVEQDMLALHYYPNTAARALANKRTNIVKVLIMEDVDTTEPYYMSLLFGFAQGLNKQGYALQLMTDKSQIDQGNADGYLITGVRRQHYEWLQRLTKPLLLFGENRQGFDFVDTDNKLGEEMATRYALSRHYAHLVFIGLDLKEAFEYSREAGYINTLQQNQQLPQILRVANHSHASQKLIHDHWREFKRNTCFICASDRLATGVVRALYTHEAHIPDEFGVIGFDGVFLDQVTSPKLTTIKQAVPEMGEILARMLLQKIAQSGAKQGEVLIKPELMVRGTTR